jgi:hypothetical protein
MASTARNVQVNLADALNMIGYEVKPSRVNPGQEFVVNIYWQAVHAMPDARRPASTRKSAAYTGFVHLVGPDGRLVTQDDHELGRGFYRTLFWQPGEVMRERYELALPKDAPSGDYALWAGAYGFPSLKRLTVRSASTSAQDDRVWLDTIHVGP